MRDDATTEVNFGHVDFPRTYKLAPRWMFRRTIRAATFLSIGALGLPALTQASRLASWELWSVASIFVLLLSVGVYMLCDCLLYKVVLMADSIEVTSGVSARRMRRDEIKGRRQIRGPTFLLIELEPINAAADKLNVRLILDTDATFDCWFSTLTDLDEQDLAEAADQLLRAQHSDSASDEGTRTIKRLRRLAVAFNIVTAGLLVEAYFQSTPSPALFIALAVMPWLAIWMVAQYQPLYRFSMNRDRNPSLALPLMAPGVALANYTFSTIHILDQSAVITSTCVAATLLTVAASAADPWLRKRGNDVFALFVFATVYGYGAGSGINAVTDSSSPQVYAATVLSKSVSHGHRSTKRYLRLGAWGPFHRASQVTVSARQYRSSRRGDTVCAYLHSGRFGIRWYVIGDCALPSAAIANSPTESLSPMSRYQ